MEIPCNIVGTLPCQIPPPVQPTPAPAPSALFTLAGNVRDAVSRQSVINATIALSTGVDTRTDLAGHYMISNVAAGDLTVTASAPGYTTQTQRFALSSDSSVDFVLQHTLSTTPTPTPPPPLIPTHGGIRSDTITIQHDLIVGSPIPTLDANAEFCCWPFPVTNPGVYDLALSRFPLDNLPSGGNSNIVSASEMILAGVQFAKASTQSTTFTWHRVSEGIDSTFSYIATGAGAHVTALSYVGHFSWEITLPGWYYVIIETEWGTVTIDFIVR